MKNDTLDLFKITKETPLSDGGVQWEVEYSDKFKELYKTCTGKQRAHKKSMAKWFVEIITKRSKEDVALSKEGE